MRIPVLQFLCFAYLATALTLAFRTNRKTLWVLALLAITAFATSVILWFMPLGLHSTSKALLIASFFSKFGFAFVFMIFPVILSIDAFITQHKATIISASLSVLVTVLFFTMFSLSST